MAHRGCSYNPRLGKSKSEKAGAEFIRRHVRHHILDLGMSARQAVRAAYDEARAKGYQVPASNKWAKLPDAWLFGKDRSTDPLDLIAPTVGRAARAAKRMGKKRKKRKRRSNPRSPIIGDMLVAVEYEGGDGEKERGVVYRHDFKGYGAKVIGLKDGSVLLRRGSKKLWRMHD